MPWEELVSTACLVGAVMAVGGSLPLLAAWRMARIAAPPAEIARPLPRTLLALWLSGSAAFTTASGLVAVAVISYESLRRHGFSVADWYPLPLPRDYELCGILTLFATWAGLAAFALGETLFTQSARPVRSLVLTLASALAAVVPVLAQSNAWMLVIATPLVAAVGHYFARR